jgi:alpha-tubulin suppressor-like RCC1 family protein
VIAYFRSAFITVAAGAYHTCALQPTGKMACWGRNSEGQLGAGVFTDTGLPPTPVPGITSAVAIAAGGYHTCALLPGGTVQCWGRNKEGQVGIASFGASSATPAAVPGITEALAVTAGGYHTCVVKAGGTASCWGANEDWQLGANTPSDHSSSPVTVPLSGLTAQIAAGGFHTCAIVAADSTVACWGSNSNGQLGLGYFSESELPGGKVQIQDPGCGGDPTVGCADTTTFLTAKTIAASIGVGSPLGGYHSVAVDSTGQNWGWGYNNDAEVFPITVTPFSFTSNLPYAVKDPIFLPTPNFLSIAAGAYHTCMLRNAGLGVFCHGNNNNGQLGPTPGGFVPTTQLAVGLAAGGYHTCTVQPILFGNPTPPGGVVECWGENGFGQVNGVPGGNVTVPAVIIVP